MTDIPLILEVIKLAKAISNQKLGKTANIELPFKFKSLS
jgi:hypothetical protein